LVFRGEKYNWGQEKGPGRNRTLSPKTELALLVALIRILLAGFAGLLARLILAWALLARLTLLLPGLLARLRLVLVLLRIVLARLVVLIGHVSNSVEWGYPSLILNPGLKASFR
jgi:hypothetical protein